MAKGDYLDYKLTISHVAWRSFQEEFSDSQQLDVDYWTFRRILSDLGKLIVEKVLENERGFYLPYGAGWLVMAGMKVKNKGKYVRKFKDLDYYRTNNYVYGMRWIMQRQKSSMKHQKFYAFRTAKLVTKQIIEKIRTDQFSHWLKVARLKDLVYIKYY